MVLAYFPHGTYRSKPPPVAASFCHNLIQAGVSLDQVAVLAGHITNDGRPNVKTTVIYTQPGYADLRAAVLSDYFFIDFESVYMISSLQESDDMSDEKKNKRSSNWGGKRYGAGRPGPRRKNHSVKFSDAEWNEISVRAAADNITAAEYIRQKSLK